MKVINSLIAVEVPSGSRNHKIVDVGQRQYLQWDVGLATGMDKLPFPAEIIGLASEIDAWKIIDVFVAAQFESATTNLSSGLQTLLSAHSLTTTPTTDIIFLSKKL